MGKGQKIVIDFEAANHRIRHLIKRKIMRKDEIILHFTLFACTARLNCSFADLHILCISDNSLYTPQSTLCSTGIACLAAKRDLRPQTTWNIEEKRVRSMREYRSADYGLESTRFERGRQGAKYRC